MGKLQKETTTRILKLDLRFFTCVLTQTDSDLAQAGHNILGTGNR